MALFFRVQNFCPIGKSHYASSGVKLLIDSLAKAEY
jgi:hypothetical protein